MPSTPPQSNAPAAGGCLLAAGIIGGAIIGVIVNQPSAGIVLGGVAGVVVATILFLIDRRR